MLLWHCLQWLLISSWADISLWSNIKCFLTFEPSHPWVEFSRSSLYKFSIALNISLGVFKDDTCDIQWRRKYSSLFGLGLSFALFWLHLPMDQQLLLWHSSPWHASLSMRSTFSMLRSSRLFQSFPQSWYYFLSR